MKRNTMTSPPLEKDLLEEETLKIIESIFITFGNTSKIFYEEIKVSEVEKNLFKVEVPFDFEGKIKITPVAK